MTFRLNCLEPVAAVCCAVGAVSMHALDAGLAAGAVVGSVGLFARLRENMRKAGLEAPELMRKMALAVIREEDRWDQSQEDRDVLALADAAMAQWLPQVMLSREELARSAADKAGMPYPRYAALLIVDRLAGKDALFAPATDPAAAEPLPRRFARTVIERALDVALDDPEYRSRLSVDFLIAISGKLADIEAQNAETHARLDALPDTDQLRTIFAEELAKAQAKGVEQSVVLALARRITPTVQNVEEAIVQLDSAIDAFVRQRDAAARGTNFGDLIDAALREIAERNAAADFERGAEVGDRAYARLQEQETELKAARIRMAEVNLDQARLLSDAERIAHWHMERLSFDGELFSQAYGALQAYRNRGVTHGIRLDLDVSIAMSRRLLEAASTDPIRGLAANALGIAMTDQGKRTAGAEGLSLLAQAAAAFNAALAASSKEVTRGIWTTAQSNLGGALHAQAMRNAGKEKAALLSKAVDAYRAALKFTFKNTMPNEWASTQNNLAIALRAQGTMAPNAKGEALLSEAIATYREILSVYTRDTAPNDWAMAHNNLGGALKTLGEMIGSPKGKPFLLEAIEAFEDALTIRTRHEMPANWAMTQYNLAVTYEALADLNEDREDNLARTEAGLVNTLEVFTPEHMSFDNLRTLRSLDRVRAKRAALTR